MMHLGDPFSRQSWDKPAKESERENEDNDTDILDDTKDLEQL